MNNDNNIVLNSSSYVAQLSSIFNNITYYCIFESKTWEYMYCFINILNTKLDNNLFIYIKLDDLDNNYIHFTFYLINTKK